MTRRTRFAHCLLLALCACASQQREPIVRWDSAKALEQFSFTDARAWRWCEQPDCAGCLELLGTSEYAPPHRSPIHLAVFHGAEFGDFDLRVEAQQTGREYPHRDLVLVFGYRDPAHFAYAHLASAADGSAHHIQLVNGKDREPVTRSRSNGVSWGNGWHELRLRRVGGRVDAWFDGELALSADGLEQPGRVGLGSFDDQGRFRSLRIERL